MKDSNIIVVLSFTVGAVVLVLGIMSVRLISERITNARTRKVVQSYAPSFSREEEQPQENAKSSAVSGFLESQYLRAAKQIEQAGIKLEPNQWLLVQVAIFFVSLLVVMLLSRNIGIAFLVSIALAIVAPGQIVKMRFKKRLISFETELPETLMLVASALRSGLSFQQALESTVSERESELGSQMRIAINESKLGPPLEESLNRVADRMQSEDLRWLVAALEIQREVGGTLSTILDTAAATIKGREELRREVRSLSAEGRLSAYVLIGLPLIIFLVLFVSRPNYVEIFWTELIGIVMLIGILVMIVIGWVWMNKMIQIKV